MDNYAPNFYLSLSLHPKSEFCKVTTLHDGAQFLIHF